MRSNIGAESPGKAIVCNNMYCASASISCSHNAEETVVVEGKRGKRNTKKFFSFLFKVEVNIVPCHLMVEYFLNMEGMKISSALKSCSWIGYSLRYTLIRQFLNSLHEKKSYLDLRPGETDLSNCLGKEMSYEGFGKAFKTN